MTNFDKTFITITARGEWISKARSRPKRPGSPTLSLTSLNESRLAVKTKNPIPPAVADIFQLILTLAEVWGRGGGTKFSLGIVLLCHAQQHRKISYQFSFSKLMENSHEILDD